MSPTDTQTIDSVRPIHVIARDIRKAWPKVYFGAVPYLDAMGSLHSIDDNFGYDDARSIVTYFLSNANTFRGPEAKALKDELKRLLKVKR